MKEESQCRRKRHVRNINRLADESRSKTKNRIPSRESNHKQEARHSARSVVTSQAILLELMVPWEDGIEDAYEYKSLKYQECVKDIKQNGWKP